MKLLFVTCFLLTGFVAHCQKILKSVVVNEANNLPVTKATIFINGTSIGTTTNERGEFTLRIPAGRHVLIGVSPGFETYKQFISPDGILDSVISLETKPQSSQNNSYQKGGWQKWGEYFLSNFLGDTRNEQECKIKNTKAIRFQVSSHGDLLAYADEPLIIENKTLGYTILYQLDTFRSNFNTLVVSYTGYSFFQPMNGNTSQRLQWEKRRKQIYLGSMMHFMRSVYRNQLEEEGFDVRVLKKVRSLPATTGTGNLYDAKINDSMVASSPGDSINAIEDQILNPDNYRDVIGPSLPGDSIAYAIGKITAGLYFDNFLLVNYKAMPGNEQYKGTGMMSQLTLINKRPLEIESDGSFYDYRNLLVTGYWSWSEKIHRCLPLDYVPINK